MTATIKNELRAAQLLPWAAYCARAAEHPETVRVHLLTTAELRAQARSLYAEAESLSPGITKHRKEKV